MSGSCDSCGAGASYRIYSHEGEVFSLCEPCGSRLEANILDANDRLAQMEGERILLSRFVDTWRGSLWEVLGESGEVEEVTA